MRVVEGILFEPVGCLAEFPPDPFLEIASRLYGRKRKFSASGSRAFWHLLNLMESAGELDGDRKELVEALELQAVAGASMYEDVIPALVELKAMGVKLFVASSLSGAAVTQFLRLNALHALFSGFWDRDSAGGAKAAPLKAAVSDASLNPENSMYLTDTLEGLKAAQTLRLRSILMMNDPDEARHLAMHNPSGGIVSLHELPDFMRFLAAQNSILPDDGQL